MIISTERAYLRVLEFIKRLDVPIRTGEGEIHVLALQHADAVELAKTLNEIVTGAASAATGGGTPGKGSTPLSIFESGVKVSADKATNSIVVTSSLRDFANLRTVIDRLDQPRRQVFIEAVIMDLNIKRENKTDMSFHAASAPNNVIGTGQSLLYGGLNPFRSIALPSPTDTNLGALALGIRGPGVSGTENLLGTGHFHTGLRHSSRRGGHDERRRHSLDAPHSGDGQRSRGNQRRAEHPAPDELRWDRSAPGGQRIVGAEWPRGAHRIRRRDRPAPGHRDEGQNRAPFERLG